MSRCRAPSAGRCGRQRGSSLLVHTTQRMFPLGLCQYLEDRYVFSLGPRCFSFAPFPEDTPTPVPSSALRFLSGVGSHL